jgi:fatty-acyl-CoA synthase
VEQTFADLLLARADDDHPGLLFEDERYTWAEVVAAARVRAGLAARLAAETAEERGDRPLHVGVLLENVPEYIYWIGAAALAGVTLVGINPTRRGSELAADIRHTDCDVIITDPALAELLAGLDTGVPPARLLLVGTAAYERHLHRPAVESPLGAPADRVPPTETVAGPSAAAARGASRPTVAGPSAPTAAGTSAAKGGVAGRVAGGPGVGDRLLLLFTSGSTGAPKAVACSQGRLAAIGTYGGQFGIGRDSVTYIAMPLFHGNAIMANLAMAVAAGATVAMRRRFSASGFVADVRRYGVTYFNYVGRALAYILATPAGPHDAASSLRVAFGTEASAQDMRRFGERFGCRVIEGYGSSEGAIALRKTPETPPDALGVAQRDIEVAVLDPETGRECPRARFGPDGGLLNPDEAIGELAGLNVARAFEGYYKNPAADAERVRDGRYWSGDLAYRDEAGFFYFAGRGADRLRVDSENFAAAPVERILSRWAPVVMCAVYPVPDPRTGDQVMAALELDGPFDAEDFAAFLKGQRDLGTKWAPRFVRIVGDMPLTSTNKVDKRPLRRERWDCGDPVWWRPGREIQYVRLEPERAAGLRAEFAAYGREHMLIGQ